MTDMPQPIAYTEYEGDYLMPWVTWDMRNASRDANGRPTQSNPDRAHVVYFDDGNVFDMANGWRSSDAEKRADNLARVKTALAANEGRYNGHSAPPPPRSLEDVKRLLTALSAA